MTRSSLRSAALLALLGAAAALRRDLPDMRASTIGTHELPGWEGERARGGAVGKQRVGAGRAYNMSYLSWDPRIILAEGFLSKEEADHIIALARSNMERSSVVDSQSGNSVVDNIRTSTGTFLRPNQDEVVARIQQRVAELSMLPVENHEALQVLHYGLHEKYGAHMDTFFDKRQVGPENGLQRIATALMFLNEPVEGGETVFPNVPAENSGPEWSECARHALAHKPRVGDMVLFWSLKPDGEIDMGATHTACPVIRGEKWSAPLWMRQGPFQQSPKRVTAAPNGERSVGETCVDLHPECAAWASGGECKRNPSYMIGDLGQCRESCNDCPYPTRRFGRKGGSPKN